MNMTTKSALAIILLCGLAGTTNISRADERRPAEAKPAAASTKLKPYPLKTCVVSEEKLGEMGEPYVFAYKDREIKLCCDGCKKKFDKNAPKFVKDLEKAEKAALKTSPSTDESRSRNHSHGK